MRWYEYKMEVDDLHASEGLKAKLLAMQAKADASGATPKPQLNPAPAPGPAKKKKAIRFPGRRVLEAAACAARCRPSSCPRSRRRRILSQLPPQLRPRPRRRRSG